MAGATARCPWLGGAGECQSDALSLVDVTPDTAGRLLVQAAGSAWVAGDAVAAAKAADHAETLPQARHARAMARLVSTDVA